MSIFIIGPNGAPLVVEGDPPPILHPGQEPIDPASEHQVTPVHLAYWPQPADHVQQLALLDGFATCPVCTGWTFTPCVCGSCPSCCTGRR
jgi:hypothetical protein